MCRIRVLLEGYIGISMYLFHRNTFLTRKGNILPMIGTSELYKFIHRGVILTNYFTESNQCESSWTGWACTYKQQSHLLCRYLTVLLWYCCFTV